MLTVKASPLLNEHNLPRALHFMLPQAGENIHSRTGEPWGRRLWLALIAVIIISCAIDSYGITTWPMADDEVPTLVELGLTHVDASAFSVPGNQIGKLPKALPVWYAFQRFAIGLLPHNQFGFRLPSLISAVLKSGIRGTERQGLTPSVGQGDFRKPETNRFSGGGLDP